MNPFEYVNPSSLKEVPELLGRSRDRSSVPIAGGIDLLGELKDDLITPGRLVNLKALEDLRFIRHEAKGLSVGATTTLTEVVKDARIQKDYAALAQAAESVASLQIRNVGTVGGNLCQRPRCWYYRDTAFNCLKKGGHTCFAVDGLNKYHAILGGGPCHIVHPSDLAPALIALGARVSIHGPKGERTEALEDFYVLPYDRLQQETVLAPDEVVTRVTVPKPAVGSKSVYLKFKEKGSMDFALSAAAASVRVVGGVCREARLVLGGVAPKPWTVDTGLLVGKQVSEETANAVADAALKEAEPLRDNAFKVPLTKTMIRRALLSAVA